MVRRRLGPSGARRGRCSARRVAAIGPATAEALARLGADRRGGARRVRGGGAARARCGRLSRRRPRPAAARGRDPRRARARARRARGPGGRGGGLPHAAGRRAPRGCARRSRGRGWTWSPSPARPRCGNFGALFAPGELPRLLRGVSVACIGPITRATAEGLGLATAIMPEEYTIPALARAIAAHFEHRKELSACRTPSTVRAGCASRRCCARWSARPRCAPTTSSTRSSWCTAAACASPSAPCPGSSGSPSTSC